MRISPFDAMQEAIDVIKESPHPQYKIAASLLKPEESLEKTKNFSQAQETKKDILISSTNYWPKPLRDNIGTSQKIGNSSGTIHAETACLLKGLPTKGAYVFISDPPCPNCVKNMAEAGIEKLYIDHKGFNKDWLLKNEGHFINMSMKIAEYAGMHVFEINRKDHKIQPIFIPDDGFSPQEENPVLEKIISADLANTLKSEDYQKIYGLDEHNNHNELNELKNSSSYQSFLKLCATQKKLYKEDPFACALAFSVQNPSQIQFISASLYPIIGFANTTKEQEDSKYSFYQQPLNRVLMHSCKQGYKIINGFVFSSRVPTSRELVNFIGADLNTLFIENQSSARDQSALKALHILKNCKALNCLSC